MAKLKQDIKDFLEFHAQKYNQPSFILDDPISLPHQFSKLQDIEIIGFWTAVLSWGRRQTIIKKANELVSLMDGAPYDFIMNHREKDRKKFEAFKHRTFQPIDTLYFLEFFQQYYQENDSLENAFLKGVNKDVETVETGLINFHRAFFSYPNAPHRTRKHVPTPERKSTCKRINMFLRWMVRRDEKGVDFGKWSGIKPSQLLIPLDLHVDKTARRLGLLQRKQTDWKAVLELTGTLRKFDPQDPVKYDFALFGLGVLQQDW